MSPEQQDGAQAVDQRADVFALGRILAQLDLGGRESQAIAAMACAARGEDRYADMAELLADLARFQAGEEVRALPGGLGLKLLRFYRKYRAAVWLVAAYALMRVAFELYRVWQETKNS